MNASVRRLQRLELLVPDLERATRFYTQVWGLEVIATDASVCVDLAAASRLPGHLSLRKGTRAALGRTWFAVDTVAELEALAERARAHGANVRASAAGQGFEVDGPAGLPMGIVSAPESAGSGQTGATDTSRPLCLTHVVINTPTLDAHVAFLVEGLGFRISDITARMVFLRCSTDHHTLALARGEGVSLNHAAYAMHGIDGLMHGAGRLIDHGHAVEWGLGRHGPGNNVFSYFIDPDGFAVEYTTEMEQVSADYVGQDAAYWDAFPRRPCRWGVARKPSDRLALAFAGDGQATGVSRNSLSAPLPSGKP